MVVEWIDDRTYEVRPDLGAGECSPASPAPSSSDVQYVNDLADDFGDLYDDSPDGPEWAIVAGAAIVGTGFVLALGALCVIGAVAVARWLGWAS